jgi:hypothetical protein
MHLGKRKEKHTSGKRKLRRRYFLACWPDDVVGWLRIPSMIMFLIGLLGILKTTWPLTSRYLKSFNLPPVEFCWLMLIAGGTVYLMSVICWLCFNDDRETWRPCSSDTQTSEQWRSL